MRHFKKILFVTLAFTLLLGICCVPAMAKSIISDNNYSGWTNPDAPVPSVPNVVLNAASTDPETAYVYSIDEAVLVLRDAMKRKVMAINIEIENDHAPYSDYYAWFENEYENWEAAAVNAVNNEVTAHNGVPTEGDYLRHQQNGWDFSYGTAGKTQNNNLITYINWTSKGYYTTVEQEAAVDAMIPGIIDSLNLYPGMSRYEKAQRIHDYISSNVVYDHEHKDDPTYLYCHSAAAALLEGTAVCQGYATLFYRLCLECDLDARYIYGKGYGGTTWEDHGWNIAVMDDGIAYYVDTTWDSAYYEAGVESGYYNYFLKGANTFSTDHTPDAQSLAEIGDGYTISATDFDSTSISWSNTWIPEDAFGEVEFSIEKQTTAWNADGTISDGEYFEVEIDPAWLSYGLSGDNLEDAFSYAQGIKPQLFMSWDANYVYTATVYTVPYGHDNRWDADPSLMWYSGCVQFNYANYNEVAAEYRLEYGVGLSSDTGNMLYSVWADGCGSGYIPSESDAMAWLEGKTLTYETRVPWSAFADEETRVPWSAFADEDNTGYRAGNGFNMCLVWEIGKGETYNGIQLAEGCLGAGKHAENFARVTLVGPEEEAEAEFADGVKLNAKSLSLSGDIGVNFKMTVPSQYVNDSYMTFTVHGRTQTIQTSSLTPNSSGQYVFTCYVTSIEMAEQIQATFSYGEYTASMTYSVADYIAAYEAVSGSYAQEITDLVHALADYGHHAQVFLSKYRSWSIGNEYAEMSGYNNSYSTSVVNETQTALQPYALNYTTNADISAVNISLNLKSQTSIYVYVTPITGYTGSLTCTEGYAVKQVGARYRVIIPNVMAHQLGDMHTLHLTTTAGSVEVHVSALSYANSIFNSSSMGTTDKYFAVALFKYYQAATALN